MAGKLNGIVLDSGALILADKNDRRFWSLWKRSLQQGLELIVPATVLAQAWRGGSKNARMALVLKSCGVEPLSEKSARMVGECCSKANAKDIVDANVVVVASERGYAILTCDSGDLVPLAAQARKRPAVLDLSLLK